MTYVQAENPLPREIADGVFWLGQCALLPVKGTLLHGYQSVYLVAGSEHSMLIEAGASQDWDVISAQVEQLMAAGVPEPRYLFVTHTEVPHAGGMGRLLSRFPNAIACGDVSDLHLVFPDATERMRFLNPGDTLDLGDRSFHVVEAVFRDAITTRWGYDAKARVLFAGDGFSYCHYHEAGQCGSLAEETASLEIADQVALFALAAFYWTQYVDVEPFISRLEELIFDELGAAIIAPTHGLPIGDPAATLPLVSHGLRAGSEMSTREQLIDGT